LSMKIPRSIARPECRRTGQSTINVKALFRAAANAWIAPDVSSSVPVHDTHSLIDRPGAAALAGAQGARPAAMAASAIAANALR